VRLPSVCIPLDHLFDAAVMQRQVCAPLRTTFLHGLGSRAAFAVKDSLRPYGCQREGLPLPDVMYNSLSQASKRATMQTQLVLTNVACIWDSVQRQREAPKTASWPLPCNMH
jgi:hypothetical protein